VRVQEVVDRDVVEARVELLEEEVLDDARERDRRSHRGDESDPHRTLAQHGTGGERARHRDRSEEQHRDRAIGDGAAREDAEPIARGERRTERERDDGARDRAAEHGERPQGQHQTRPTFRNAQARGHDVVHVAPYARKPSRSLVLPYQCEARVDALSVRQNAVRAADLCP
jgi:hypothetical protein